MNISLVGLDDHVVGSIHLYLHSRRRAITLRWHIRSFLYSGANTNGSQFFICTVDDTKKLAKSYNLFGYVQTGMDVVLKIAQGDTMTSVTVQEEIS